MFIRRVLKTVFLRGGGFDLRAPRSRRSKSNLPQRWGFSTRGVYIIFLVECTEIRAFWGIEHQKKIQSTFPFFNHHHHFYFGAGNFGFILFSFLKNLTFPFFVYVGAFVLKTTRIAAADWKVLFQCHMTLKRTFQSAWKNSPKISIVSLKGELNSFYPKFVFSEK